ncbi:ABC transporter ATP-binding protein [Catenulispora yoronensis]
MPAIEVAHLRKTYAGTTAVADVSFDVAEGEIFGILGPNGAGKTTTVECVSGLRTPDGGRVRVLGLDPRLDREDVRQLLGVQLQESRLPARIRVREALELYASFYRAPADVGELLELWGLADKAEARFGKLSGGQRQRLAVALAMVGNPRVVVLDELTTGLDPQARRTAWDMVRKVRDAGVTVLLVTHFMEEAERLCDRLAVIDRGRVAALDTPAGLTGRGPAGAQRMRFRLSQPIDAADLLALPEVTAAERRGDHWEVTGDAEVIGAVTAHLARRQIIAGELRVAQTSLDDAFIALTSHARAGADGRQEA